MEERTATPPTIRVLISEDKIRERVGELGRQIRADYGDSPDLPGRDPEGRVHFPERLGAGHSWPGPL